MQKVYPFPSSPKGRSGRRYRACGYGQCRGGMRSLSHAAALMLALIVTGGMAVTAVASQFSPPSLEGFARTDQHDADGDGDGVKETRIQNYSNAAGDSIFSMTTKGRVWAWSLETRGESTAGPQNYVIRDSNCDGVFDEVYSLDDKFYVPDCLK
jgi:hypothetical protein